MIGDLRLCDLCIAANAAWAAGKRGDYDAGDCHVYRTDEYGCTVLAAAGSEQDEDWLTDLKAGWAADASAVLPLVLAARITNPLVLCGHSKGGPDILDLADRLIQHNVAIGRLTTFEAAIAGWHDGRLAGVAGIDWGHHGDLVPLLPFGWRRPRPIDWLLAPALPDFPDPWSNHSLTGAVRPALVAQGVTS